MFKDLYKQRSSGGSLSDLQRERRAKLLKEQKQKRCELQDQIRSLPLNNEAKKHKGYHRRKPNTFKEAYHSYADISLQLSEWMRDKPDDLCNWFLVPCPKGQRCMVVACDERTEMYSKTGRRRISFKSLLPGGATGKRSFTLLDCVYAQEEDTFYVLDAMAYGNHNLLECEAQFRFFWLRSQFDENEILCKRSASNEKPFHLLERYDFESIERISMALQRFPLWTDNRPQLDGFLFYHKESSYICGTTPLVCWLFAFMIPDLLDLPVNTAYETPEDYQNPLQYIEQFEQQLARKRAPSKSPNKATITADELELKAATNDTSDNDMEHSSLQDILDAERLLEME